MSAPSLSVEEGSFGIHYASGETGGGCFSCGAGPGLVLPLTHGGKRIRESQDGKVVQGLDSTHRSEVVELSLSLSQSPVMGMQITPWHWPVPFWLSYNRRAPWLLPGM